MNYLMDKKGEKRGGGGGRGRGGGGGQGGLTNRLKCIIADHKDLNPICIINGERRGS